MEDTILRLIEQLPLSIGVLIIMFYLGRRFICVWEAQVASGDKLLDKSLDRNAMLDMKVDALAVLTQDIVKVVDSSHTTLKGLTEQMTQTAQYLSKTAEALKALELRVIQGEEHIFDYFEKANTVGQELKTDMSELKNGNGEILNELRTIRAELARVADAVEVAMADLIATVDKLTKAPTASHDETNITTSKDDE